MGKACCTGELQFAAASGNIGYFIAGEGVIQTRGPHTMLGYWSKGGLDLTAQPGQWFSTGDIGKLALPRPFLILKTS